MRNRLVAEMTDEILGFGRSSRYCATQL